MPWFPATITEARKDEIIGANTIAKWPRPNSTRIEPRFRLISGVGTPYPRASRVLFLIQPFQTSVEEFGGWIDLVYRPGTDDFFGSSGLSVDGREMTLTMTEYEPDLDPVHGFNGIAYLWTYQKDGGGISSLNYFWSTTGFGKYTTPLQAKHTTGFEGWFTSDSGPVAPTDWTKIPMTGGHDWWSTNECYLLEEEAAAPLLFAEFNESNTYTWVDFAPNFTDAWRFEYDIRNQSNATVKEVMGTRLNTLQSHYWSGRFCAWRGSLVDTGSFLPLNTWVHVDFDYEWQTPASALLRCFRDGVPAGTNIVTTGIAFGDQFGQRGPTISGTFDLRNFKLFYGDESSPDIGYDFPMDVNACDESPNLLGGTTTGMALPSCPP